MKVVIIGTGNTASVLGRKLKKAGHQIVQVFGRNSREASQLAYELGTESTNYWNVVNRNADLYIIAVSDMAIKEIIQELRLPEKTIVHTAASVSKNILKPATDHYGVFYPLQSLRKDSIELPDMPLIIDAADDHTLLELEQLAHTISNQVVFAGDEERSKLHLAAVFCNNFVNHLLALAADYCNKEKLDFNLMLPLIHETLSRIETAPPSHWQTGPAVRHDITTMEKHLDLLKTHPHLKEIYQLFSKSIRESDGSY